jgi:hypothetical protein
LPALLPCRVSYENHGKYFRIGDRAVLEESYDAVIKSAVNSAPRPAGIPPLLRSKKHPKAQNAKPEYYVGELDQSGFITGLLAGAVGLFKEGAGRLLRLKGLSPDFSRICSDIKGKRFNPKC